MAGAGNRVAERHCRFAAAGLGRTDTEFAIGILDVCEGALGARE
jgi:hypothetical protein